MVDATGAFDAGRRDPPGPDRAARAWSWRAGGACQASAGHAARRGLAVVTAARDRPRRQRPRHRGPGIDEAVNVVARGGLVVLPTDTVYGIGADAFTPPAVAALLAAKGRGRADAAAGPGARRRAPSTASRPTCPTTRARSSRRSGPAGSRSSCARSRRWPGTSATRGGTVALRMPRPPAALRAARRTGPLAVSSANRTGEPAALTAQEAERAARRRACGSTSTAAASPGGVASTIVDATGATTCGSSAPGRCPSKRCAGRAGRRTRRAGRPDDEPAASRGEGLPARHARRGRGHLPADAGGALGGPAHRGDHRGARARRARRPDAAAGRGRDARRARGRAGGREPDAVPRRACSRTPGGAWGIVGAAAIVCVLGVADDIWDLDWITKLAGQSLAGGVPGLPGRAAVPVPVRRRRLLVGSPRLSLFVTVLVVVVAMNAVNFVDGLDGLAAGHHRHRRHRRSSSTPTC